MCCDLTFAASFMLLYLNEYQLAQAVYTFHGDSKLWLENITKAQVLLYFSKCHCLQLVLLQCCLNFQKKLFKTAREPPSKA